MIEDLHDDDIRWNGFAARNRLRQIGAPAIPALREALDSVDHQQRQWSASILRELVEEPTYRLLEVCVEALMDDPHYGSRSMSNMNEAAEYLSAEPERTRRVARLLQRLIESNERQSRFLAAWLVVEAEYSPLLSKSIEVLVGHLRHNGVEGDAGTAARALVELGHMGAGQLRRILEDSEGLDRQQRASLALILENIENPPNEAELRRRRNMRTPLSNYGDPSLGSGHNYWFWNSGIYNERMRTRLRQAGPYGGVLPEIERLPAFQALPSRPQPRLKIDHWDIDYVEVGIGVFRPDFDRAFTLRVWEDGRIDHWVERGDDDGRWVMIRSEPPR